MMETQLEEQVENFDNKIMDGEAYDFFTYALPKYQQ